MASVWYEGIPAARVASAPGPSSLAVDVAIVGAGITGLTTALRLHESGLRVVVVERDGVPCMILPLQISLWPWLRMVPVRILEPVGSIMDVNRPRIALGPWDDAAFECALEAIWTLRNEWETLRVDEKLVSTLVGKVGRADADFVKASTGFSIGGVSPVAHTTAPVILIDRELFRFGEIWAAAGHPHAVFPLSPDELVSLTGAPVEAVTSA